MKFLMLLSLLWPPHNALTVTNPLRDSDGVIHTHFGAWCSNPRHGRRHAPKVYVNGVRARRCLDFMDSKGNLRRMNDWNGKAPGCEYFALGTGIVPSIWSQPRWRDPNTTIVVKVRK